MAEHANGLPAGLPVPPPPPFGFTNVVTGGPPPPPPAGQSVLPAVPPLPYGWVQHFAPDTNIPYYYNTMTKESTYVRPLPPLPPGFAPPFPPVVPSPPAPASQLEPKKKKEKPKEKIPIPGTTWTKVITTAGNIFFTEKESKRSSWTIPDDIQEEVAAYEESVKQAEREREEAERREKEKERLDVLKERERIRLEIEEERQLKRELEEERRAQEREAQRKRKEMDQADATDNHDDIERPSKVQRVDEEVVSEDDAEEGEGQAGPLDEEDEEAWQKAVAAEIAAEHAIAEAEKKAQKAAAKAEQEEAKRAVFHAPAKVDLTLEEGRALFKALLHEKDISPFATWDTSLPLFINDPRYVLLSSLKDRREVFEEYCREVARSRRLGKGSSASRPSSGQGEKKDPEKEYRELLRTEVKSTRTIWEDFRRSWKKDRRFWSYGKDDRAREKLFRVHLKELGERKRADAKRAEADFLDLLKEHGDLTPESDWKQVKRSMVDDPRYDAVGSSSLREQLFRSYIEQLLTGPQAEASGEDEAARKAREKKEKAAASLKQRERQVQEAKMQANRELHRSRIGAGREEGEREFGSLLVQAVREHDAKWSEVAPQLESDPRFHHEALHVGDKQRMFRDHLQDLARKRLAALHALFAKHAPNLNTSFEEVYPEIANDFAVKRLKLTPEALQDKYDTWQRVRFQDSRRDFDTMLGESSFVEFWGRLRKKSLDQAAMAIKDEDEDEDEDIGAGGGGRASLADMAKHIDLAEMRAVLQNDKRYTVFDYIPEQRDEWIKQHLEGLEVAKATVHQTNA